MDIGSYDACYCASLQLCLVMYSQEYECSLGLITDNDQRCVEAQKFTNKCNKIYKNLNALFFYILLTF